MAQRDLPPVELPIQRVPQEVASLREEIASTPLSLEAKIDQFHLEEEGEVPKRLVELSNSEANLDRFSAAHSSRLIVARVDTSLKDERGMDLKQRTSLNGLLANRNKGSASKDVPKTQVPPSLPPLPLLVTMVGLLLNPELKRKRKVQEVKEGEVIPPRGAKQPKNVKDKRAPSIESHEESSSGEVLQGVCIWAPRLELDGAPIPWDATIWESQRAHATHLAKALEQLLLLPRDMEGFKHTRQPDLFMSLKKDLAMVSQSTSFFVKY